MRRGVVVVLLLVLGAAPAFARERLFSLFGGGGMMRGPEQAFSPEDAPPAPDYADPAAWAVRPGQPSPADTTPSGVSPIDPALAKVDVFFIHPTSYLRGDTWNQNLGDSAVNARTDEGTIANQASVFNGCCRIYAPRYRQAVLAAFFTRRKSDAEGALDLAYQDVRAAFRHYIAHDNHGRPFIIASHSQGSRHAIRLLADEIAGTPLEKRMVAAYVVGYALPMDIFARNLKGMSLCRSAGDIGCVVTWSTYARGAAARWSRDVVTQTYAEGVEANRGKALACTNPLSWLADESLAPATANLGAWSSRMGGAPKTGAAAAQCSGGVLYADISPTVAAGFHGSKMQNFHILDYQLFYMNIRANAIARSAAYFSRQGQ